MIGHSTLRRSVFTLTMTVILLVAAAAPAADVTANAGIFAQGKWQGAVKGGYVSTSGDDYLMLGANIGYAIVNGLTAGLDYETWLIGSPTVNKLAPWIGYTFYKAQKVKPYVAAFYRQNWVSGYDDYQDIGGRAGIYIPQGRSYLGFGVVYEYRLNDDGYYSDRSDWYPEVRFAIGF